MSIRRKMRSVDDSAQRNQLEKDDVILGTADESKAPIVKGPTVGPSTSKRRRENDDEDQAGTAPKKKKGGRQALTNTAEYVSHDQYNTVSGETKHERDQRQQRIRRHWVRKWFNYQFVAPRFAKNFAFHPPWGDCRELSLIKANGPQERPPPPENADESSLRTPASYPEELAKRQRNAVKRAEKAEKKKAREEENLRLLKDDLKKKKAEEISEGRTKHKHDPSAAVPKRKTPK